MMAAPATRFRRNSGRAMDKVATLLVVDDDRVVLATLAHGLRAEGFDVIPAASGEDALRFLQTARPDLVLLDARMAGMSGLEVAAHLQKDTSVPFMLLSAYDDDELVTEAISLGALGYLIKPLSIRQLVPAIRAALAHADEFGSVRKQRDDLERLLSTRQLVSAAIGIMTERNKIPLTEAMKRLRTRARSQQRKLEDVAQEMIASAEGTVTKAENDISDSDL